MFMYFLGYKANTPQESISESGFQYARYPAFDTSITRIFNTSITRIYNTSITRIFNICYR